MGRLLGQSSRRVDAAKNVQISVDVVVCLMTRMPWTNRRYRLPSCSVLLTHHSSPNVALLPLVTVSSLSILSGVHTGVRTYSYYLEGRHQLTATIRGARVHVVRRCIRLDTHVPNITNLSACSVYHRRESCRAVDSEFSSVH